MGITYNRINNFAIGQFYRIAVDDRDPYWIYGGLQDAHSFMGPSANAHWLGIHERRLEADRLQRRHRARGGQARPSLRVLHLQRRQPHARGRRDG